MILYETNRVKPGFQPIRIKPSVSGMLPNGRIRIKLYRGAGAHCFASLGLMSQLNMTRQPFLSSPAKINGNFNGHQ